MHFGGVATMRGGVGVLLLAAAVGLILAWCITLKRDAWAVGPAGAQWPRYVGVHHGRLVLMSTLWRPDENGRFAWRSDGWIYDTLGGGRSLAGITYARIGDSYSGVPAYKALIDGLFVPLWYFAVPPAWIGIVQVRRARRTWRIGRCKACGYSREGLPAASRCPECGAEA